MQRTPRTLVLCSDIHGAYAAVHRMLDATPDADGLIIAGDLTTRGTADEARRALESYAERLPVAIVAGNMDPRGIEPTLAAAADLIDGRAVRWGDAALFGVSGCPPTPMRTPYEIGEEEIEARAEAGWTGAAHARWRIFVPHTPPSDTALDVIPGGRHVGSRSVRALIERREPDLVVCGHIHEARGIEAIGRSVVVNCGPAHLGFFAVARIEESVTVELRS